MLAVCRCGGVRSARRTSETFVWLFRLKTLPLTENRVTGDMRGSSSARSGILWHAVLQQRLRRVFSLDVRFVEKNKQTKKKHEGPHVNECVALHLQLRTISSKLLVFSWSLQYYLFGLSG